MRKLIILAAFLALSACGLAPIGTVANIATSASSPKIEIEANRAFAMVAIAYEAVANGLIPSIEAGQISGEKAVKIQALNRKALELLRRGNAALDSGVRGAIFGELLEIVTDLQSIARNEGTLLSWDLLKSYNSVGKLCIFSTNLTALRPNSSNLAISPILTSCERSVRKSAPERSQPVSALTQL